MILFRLVLLSILVATGLACTSLSYPEPESATATSASGVPTASNSASPTPGASPAQPSAALTEPLGASPNEESELSWSDLMRLARELVQQGELVQAEERLEQASARVAYLPPDHARRKAVFGMQARLANEFATQGEFARSDELAERLFAVAEAEPEIGGDALVRLALSVANRRSAGEEPFPTAEKLRILNIALSTAQMGSASRDRFQLAFEISQLAHRDGNLDLARRAIEQAQADARTLYPRDKSQAGSISVYLARIALDQNDLETAEAAAITANQIFEESGAGEAERAIGEITLAQAMARRGDDERAILVARRAEVRLAAQPPIEGHPRRIILGGLAQVEALTGDEEAARRRYREALDVPAADFEPDRILVRDLARDLRALDVPLLDAPELDMPRSDAPQPPQPPQPPLPPSSEPPSSEPPSSE